MIKPLVDLTEEQKLMFYKLLEKTPTDQDVIDKFCASSKHHPVKSGKGVPNEEKI